MYAGILSTSHAAGWLGAHQKLDRLAYRGMRRYVLAHQEPVRARLLLAHFPPVKLIQHFEGVNGPDGIKYKSPGQDDPMHFYDPYATTKAPLFDWLELHSKELAEALRTRNEERAAFEAAWLAHTIVDGLTPAHHFPYEEALEHIRGDSGTDRVTKTQKVLVKGATTRETVKKNWQVIGAGGVIAVHVNFEAGVTSALVPLRLAHAVPSAIEVAYAQQHGLVDVFATTARAIADLNLYERFYRTGWTGTLVRDVRILLLPQMIKTVSLAWLLALEGK